MAGKVNTKFVITLTSVLALLIGGTAIFVYTVVRKSTNELVAEGDRMFYLAENRVVDPQAASPEEFAQAQAERGRDYRLAAGSYARAWNRDPQNVDLLLKYIDARRKMTVRDQFEAKNVLQDVMGRLRQATELRPEDDELLERFYQTIYGWAREFQITNFYEDLFLLASTRLENDPDNIPALKFRGIAKGIQLSDDMDRAQQQLAREDLERVLAVRPQDTDVLHFLARWHLYDANRSARADPESPAVDEGRDLALEYSQQALAAEPNNPQVSVEHLTILMAFSDTYRVAIGRTPEDSDARQTAIERFDQALARVQPVIDGIEADLLQKPEPAVIVQQVAELLPKIERQQRLLERLQSDTSTPAGPAKPHAHLKRTENLLRTAAQTRPDMLLYRLMLANVLKLQLKLDDAHAIYVLARDYPIAGNFEASLRDRVLQQQAVFEVANIELIRAESAQDPARREELLEAADRAVDDLEKASDKDARVLMLRGKIALLRGQSTQAMLYLDQASDLYQGLNIEALLLSARARQAEKQWGAAAARLEQVLQLAGQGRQESIKTNLRLQLAEMLIRSRKLPEAREQLDFALQTEPGNRTAARLLAQWYKTNGENQKAIDTLEAIGDPDAPEIARALAELYGRTGDEGRERELLESQFQQDPANLSVLQALLPLLDDNPQRLDLIDQAQAAGAPENTVALLRLQVAGRDAQTPVSLEELINQFENKDATPLARAVSKAQIYLRYQQLDKAREYYDLARQIDANSDEALLLGFELALRENNFDTARTLANEAGKRDLDLAQGHFFRGRLAAAENNLRQALASYDQALKLRPIFDEGWRQLGQLHVRAGDLSAAISAYQTALNQKPDNVRALTGLAAAYNSQGQYAQALDSLRTAIKYAPRDQTLRNEYLRYELRYGDPNTVLRMRRELAQTQPENTRNRIALALMASGRGDSERALEIIDQTQEDVGLSREIVGARAGILSSAGQPEAGEKTIRDYLESRGQEKTVQDLMLLARYQLTTRRVNESIASYREAIALENSSTRAASRELADLLFNFGQHQAAIEIYQDLFDQADENQRQALGRRLAETFLRDEQFDRAQTLIDTLEEDATTDALRALIASRQGNDQQALDYINRSLERNNRNALTYLQRARLQMQDPATLVKALDDVDQALAINPDFIQAFELKAQIQVQLNQTTEATYSLRSVLDRAPGNDNARARLIQLYLAGDRQPAAEELIREGLELSPNNPNWLRYQAGLASARGDTAGAIASLERIVAARATPQNITQLATLYLSDNQPQAAESLLSENADLLSASPVLQGLRGRALANLGQEAAASRVFTLALERSTTQQQTSAVVQSMATALGVAPAEAVIADATALTEPRWAAIAMASFLANQRQYDAAVSRLETLRDQSSASDRVAIIRIDQLIAQIHLQSSNFSAARDAYLHLLEIDPDNLAVLNNLAYIMANNLDAPQEALPIAERAAELAPDNAEVLDTLGWTYHLADQNEKALQALQSSVRLRPGPINTYHLGRILMEVGENDRARRLLNQSIQLADHARDTETATLARAALQRLR
ncbi:MAG: tetratricopeptide repeat protein [Planctomycetota bacterium]